jgi:protein TonB
LKPRTPKKVVYVRKYLPPPPPVARRRVSTPKHIKKIPVPDPTPEEPEPIREPEPEVYPDYFPSDAEILIGIPEPPPATAAAPPAPKLAGVAGVTNPERIPESYVKPVYPELARKARIEAKLILQAVITREGTVTDVQVLKCNHPLVGFEEAAIAAVEQWRYRPALQNGAPVDVFFTIVVNFTLE